MAIDIGRIAFTKYCDMMCEKFPDWKERLPTWESLEKVNQDAWRAAAVAVIQYIGDEKKRMEENPDVVG